MEYFTKREALEHAAWVMEHRASQANKIVSEIEELRLKSTELERQLEPFEKMLALLDGTGAALVDAVAALFDKPSEGLTVERTEKGAAFDLLVKYKGIKTLVIEVTGIQGVLTKDDRHWSDFMGYLPEYYARNQAEQVEHMVFVVNTECKNELKNRNRASDITYDVKMLVTNNKVCLARSCDLYNLWLKTLKGQPVLEIFNHLFNCDGVFEPPN